MHHFHQRGRTKPFFPVWHFSFHFSCKIGRSILKPGKGKKREALGTKQKQKKDDDEKEFARINLQGRKREGRKNSKEKRKSKAELYTMQTCTTSSSASMAQSVERQSHNLEVVSSILTRSTFFLVSSVYFPSFWFAFSVSLAFFLFSVFSLVESQRWCHSFLLPPHVNISIFFSFFWRKFCNHQTEWMLKLDLPIM
jgi:hypothetical protein